MCDEKKFKYGPKRWHDVGYGASYWYEKTDTMIHVCSRVRMETDGFIHGEIIGDKRYSLAEAMCAHLAGKTDNVLLNKIASQEKQLTELRRQRHELRQKLAKAEVPGWLPPENTERNPDVHPAFREALDDMCPRPKIGDTMQSIELKRYESIIQALQRIEARTSLRPRP